MYILLFFVTLRQNDLGHAELHVLLISPSFLHGLFGRESFLVVNSSIFVLWSVLIWLSSKFTDSLAVKGINVNCVGS